jgi:hypothetical protein
MQRYLASGMQANFVENNELAILGLSLFSDTLPELFFLANFHSRRT